MLSAGIAYIPIIEYRSLFEYVVYENVILLLVVSDSSSDNGLISINELESLTLDNIILLFCSVLSNPLAVGINEDNKYSVEKTL